jgi:hypothetical protein
VVLEGTGDGRDVDPRPVGDDGLHKLGEAVKATLVADLAT